MKGQYTISTLWSKSRAEYLSAIIRYLCNQLPVGIRLNVLDVKLSFSLAFIFFYAHALIRVAQEAIIDLNKVNEVHVSHSTGCTCCPTTFAVHVADMTLSQTLYRKYIRGCFSYQVACNQCGTRLFYFDLVFRNTNNMVTSHNAAYLPRKAYALYIYLFPLRK